MPHGQTGLPGQRALAVLDASPLPMILWAPIRDEAGRIVDCRYVECNSAAVEYLGEPREHFVGRRLTQLFQGATAETALRWAVRTIETNEPLLLEAQTLFGALSSDDRRFSISMTPVDDAVMFMWRDDTAVEALRASEETLRVVMQNAPVGMNLTAPDGTFLRVNPAMCKFLGRDEATLMGTTWQAITHPDDLAEDLALARAVAAGERDSYRLTKRFTWPDGSVVWGDLAVSGVRDDTGTFQFYIAQVVDVTELVKKREDLTQSQEHYRLLAEHTSDVILRVEGSRLAWVSPSVTEVLGWTPDEVLGRRIEEFLDPWQWPAVVAALRTDDSAQNGRASGKFRVRRRLDTWLWMDASARWSRFADDQIVTVVRLRNVDDEVRARTALTTSEERFRSAMHAAPIGMALTDSHGIITQSNPALSQMLGRDEHALRGLHVGALSHPDDRGIDDEMWSILLSVDTSAVTRDKRLLDRDGRVVWVHNAIAAARNEQGAVVSYVAQFLDVTQTRQATEALNRLAHHDPLTGLMNRRAVLEQVSLTLSQGASGHVATLFIDVDRFKSVNDSHGHGTGDAMLTTIAERIVGCLRHGDTVGRIGGDEFLVLLRHLTGPDDARAIADKVLRAVSLTCVLDGIPMHPTISVGVSVARVGDSADSLIARADRALYQAKAAGRNRVASGD